VQQTSTTFTTRHPTLSCLILAIQDISHSYFSNASLQVQNNLNLHQVNPTANPNITMSNTHLEARLKRAIHNFETTQQAFNIQWLQHQILACKGLDPDLDALDKRNDELKICTKHTFGSWRVTHLILLKKRKDELAKDLKFTSWDALASHHNLADVDELLSVDVGQYDKGTRPPVPEDQRLDFLDRLREGINADFDHGAAAYAPVDLPKDYPVLLSLTDGINDTDLRNSNEMGISSILNANVDGMTGYTPYNEQRDLYNTDNLPWANSTQRTGWEVCTGFILGGLTYREDPNWLAYYYCARTNSSARRWSTYPGCVDTIIADEETWKWRVFYKQKERFQHSFRDPLVFNDLIEWMEFYQQWWKRESIDYPAWHVRKVAEVELLYGRPAETDDEDDEDEKEQEVDLDIDMIFAIS
jgi:hypothetical protein